MKFPVFEQLHVENYRLYPGETNNSGLHLNLTAGPWIVLGVNGIGKSTLLLLLKYVLMGASRVRGAGFTGERSDIVSLDNRLFAVRVNDNARNATAALTIRLGRASLEIKRRLADLVLVEAILKDDTDRTSVCDEKEYRELLAKAMGLMRFEDALRVLDRLTFFLESREPLIWNVSAQFELFRAILTPEISADLRRLEGEIVSSDSAARNLNAALHKVVTRRDAEFAKRERSAETRARLAKATAELDLAETSETNLQHEVDQWEERRSDARTELKRADRAADEAAQAYQKLKFDALRHAFAGVTPNEQYVFLKLISERICICCGNSAEETAHELELRQRENRCLVCGSPRHETEKVVTTTAAVQSKAADALRTLLGARQVRDQAQSQFEEAARGFAAAVDELERARRNVDIAKREVRKLRARLPTDDQSAFARDEDRIEGLRREVLNFRRDRDTAEEEIQGLLKVLKDTTEGIREQLETNFAKRAKAFFGEEAKLVYAVRRDRIGQGGRQFDLPAFEVEMTSRATEGHFIRRMDDQVSMSQREYLDIIFRMSLIETFGASGGSMVIDGPEGALDAIFAERAGDLFAGFAGRAPDTNLILACNIVEGGFIPNTLRGSASLEARKSRVVNLLKLAVPTAALIEFHRAYEEKVETILKQQAT
jgi:predicted  nucleic acid-binding Zn-ribbon protein